MNPSPGRNDRRRFERLVRDTRDDLLAYALRRSVSPEDAADVLSEVYLIAWRKLEKLPSGERSRLWLFGVARNVMRQGAARQRSRDTVVQRLARELREASEVEPVPGPTRRNAPCKRRLQPSPTATRRS
jgi:RNA polymerase sigma-70 factor (ECF subfamily)